ncbi:hypothetical protein SAMN05444158_1756 [Bradyrhizobium canariense]|uniref:Uncharacterized protein n=1 Tax=Bradyrhizobium canariense TaxID=255045 RepID=A0A1H1REG8_9BRAD|nr:hypothetical protein SAMN05444158_1756 [Bradyrhizobium canariense]
MLFPKKERQLDKKCQISINNTDLPSVVPERQSLMPPGAGRLTGIVVRPPQLAAGIPAPA